MLRHFQDRHLRISKTLLKKCFPHRANTWILRSSRRFSLLRTITSLDLHKACPRLLKRTESSKILERVEIRLCRTSLTTTWRPALILFHWQKLKKLLLTHPLHRSSMSVHKPNSVQFLTLLRISLNLFLILVEKPWHSVTSLIDTAISAVPAAQTTFTNNLSSLLC